MIQMLPLLNFLLLGDWGGSPIYPFTTPEQL
jgi:hypothetical protein